MQEEELVQLLRESDTAEAAALLARMEPDEAADGLRELEPGEQARLLAAMPGDARDRVSTLLGYAERSAGGIMTTLLVVASPAETIMQVRDRLRANREHDEDLAGVIVLGDDGRLLDDVTMTELFLADLDGSVDSLIGPPWPVTVTADADLEEIAERLVETRHSSVVVVDEEERPLGRILVDDVLDMLVPDRRGSASPGGCRERNPGGARPAPGDVAPGPGRATRPGRRPLRRRILLVLAFMGPGIIAANAGNDAGGIATYASAGAQFGYRTLFAMVLVTVALVVVQEMCARLGAYTGEGLGALIREQFSIRVTAFALAALIVANVGLVVSEFAGIAAALELLGVSKYISVPIAAVAIWALVVFGSYKYAERLFLVLSLVFFAYPVAAFLSRPDYAQAGMDLAWPHFLATKAFLLLVVALIGTTITPYMQFYVAAAVADRGIGPAEYPGEKLDTIAGSIFCNLISIFIIVATAAAIHVRAPLESAKQAAQALAPVAGRFATQLFAVGLLGASALAAAVVPLSTAYAISEATGAERSVSKSFRQAPLFLGLFTGQVFIGAAVALVPGNLIRLLVEAQVLNGLITPILLTYVLILANRTSVLGGAANGRAFKIVATISVAAVAVLSATVLIQSVLSGLGIG